MVVVKTSGKLSVDDAFESVSVCVPVRSFGLVLPISRDAQIAIRGKAFLRPTPVLVCLSRAAASQAPLWPNVTRTHARTHRQT